MIRFSHTTKWLSLSLLMAFMLSGCYTDKSTRNIEFAPNMYNSIPLEPYSQTVMDEDSGMVKYFANGLSSQKPPEGTIPRSNSSYSGETYVPFHIDGSPQGYLASDTVASPLNDPAANGQGINCTEASFQRGKEVYEIFCIMCHGPNGKGQGSLVTKGAFLGVPDYRDRPDVTAGQMYHAITYGKGVMGSHASQLSPQQRWEVICYVQKFQAEGQAAAATASNE